MPKTDEQYIVFAQELEKDILKLCEKRQSDASVNKRDFHQKYNNHLEKKYWLDIRAKIYEFMSKHPSWKNRLDGLKFMDVLDECLRQYQPQGKFFLNFFLNRYQLRMQDTPKASYIDEKDSVFNNADSIDIATNSDENSNNKISSLDKKSVQEYKTNEIANDMDAGWILYQKALTILSAGDLKYLKYFFTLNALSSDQPKEKADCEYLVKEIFLEQLELTPKYLQEYQQAKASSPKKIQENSFVNAKYMTAIAAASGIKQDTLRKKFNLMQKIVTEIGTQLHMAEK